MVSFTELRHVFRRLRQSPGFAGTVILTFALAIGANSAIFSAVNTVLLQPMPIRAPRDLAVVWQTDEGGRAVIELTYRHLREWTASGNAFTAAAVMGSHNWSAVLEGRGEPVRVWFNGVSAAFFDTLGVKPLLGRAFQPEDDLPNAPPVAVVNYGTWVRRFGGDPAIIGKTMVLDGESVEIVGVMPEGMDFPRGAEFWAPVVPVLSAVPSQAPAVDTVGVFYVIGRMRSDLDAKRLRTELDTLEARLDEAQPGRLKWGSRAVVTPFLDHVFGPARPALRVLWAAVCVLLLIACANISGLVLTRVSRRQQEHGLRLALGASRTAVGRLWIAEVLILSAAGGLMGLVVAHWMIDAIVALAPDDLPRLGDVSIDGTVAVFTFAIVGFVALVTAAIPLRHAGTLSLFQALDGERSTTGKHTMRARSVLLVVQIALSVVLLVAAGLVLRSFIALRQVDLGFSPHRVLTFEVQPRGGSDTPNVWLRDYVDRIRALPGIEAAGAVYLRPLVLGPIGSGITVFLEGQPQTRQSAESNPILNHQVATPGYFETLKIPVHAGRLFTDRDTEKAPRVAIVSESTARRLWPGQDPLGKRLAFSAFTPGVRGIVWRTVVGVVSDVRYRGLDQTQLDVYDPALQVGLPADDIVVRTSGDPLALVGNVRAIAREMDAAAIVDGITTLDAVLRRAEAPWRLAMWMFVLFALLAFALAALGLFSVVALDVAHRQREIAIRLAIGASPGAILKSVLMRAGWRVASGLVFGFATAAAAGGAIQGLLFEIAPGDPATFACVFGVVTAAVAIAAYVPARRAAAADPHRLLRMP